MVVTSDAVADAIARLQGGALAARTRREAPLGPQTTYRVGGSAAALVAVEDADELGLLAAVVAQTGATTLVVGRGSNLLVADRGFDGIAILLGEAFAGVEVDGTRVRAGASAKLPVVARTTVQHSLTGFEWAVGVPGSIGGAVRMNAGGHGAEMVDSLVGVDVVDLCLGEQTGRSAAELDLGYRHSSIVDSDVVVASELELSEGDPDRGRTQMAEIVQWRRANQPGGQNAGSVFTNPAGESAGRLIETAGAKGLRIGTAEVSTKHANFIQADEGGSAGDIVALMNEIRRRVKETHGLELAAETRLIGFEDDVGFDEKDKA